MIGLAKRFVWFFSIRQLSQHFVFNFIQNSFVRLYHDSCHISLHFQKNLAKLVNFCKAILILKMEGKKHFWHIVIIYYFKEGKNATEMQKKNVCVQCVEKVLVNCVRSGL